MIASDVKYLCCVDCSGDLTLLESELIGPIVDHGILECAHCGRKYPILNKVAVLFRKAEFGNYIRANEIAMMREFGFDALIPENARAPRHKQSMVAENWEYQHKEVRKWEEDTEGDEIHGAAMFRKFIPIEPEAYVGRVVLTACVARGPEVFHTLNMGAAKILVNEIGDTIYDVASILADHLDRLVICRSDLSNLPFKNEVADIAICDHALQHVEDHKKGYASLSRVVRPSGIVAVCVYSQEGNFLMTHLVEPVKCVVHILPLGVQRYLSILPAVLIFLYIRVILGVRALFSERVARHLPLYEHMIFWAPNKLSFIWTACFDLIHAPISYHFSEQEMRLLGDQESQQILKLVRTHGTTWSMVAEAPGTPSS